MILQQLFNNMAIKRSKLTIICTIKITQQIAWIFLYNLESFTNSLEMNHAIFINVTIKENTWLFLANVSEKIHLQMVLMINLLMTMRKCYIMINK